MNATAERLAMLIEEAPRWARVELTASIERVRHAAAYEIADYIAERLDDTPLPVINRAQLPLPLPAGGGAKPPFFRPAE